MHAKVHIYRGNNSVFSCGIHPPIVPWILSLPFAQPTCGWPCRCAPSEAAQGQTNAAIYNMLCIYNYIMFFDLNTFCMHAVLWSKTLNWSALSTPVVKNPSQPVRKGPAQGTCLGNLAPHTSVHVCTMKKTKLILRSMGNKMDYYFQEMLITLQQ